MYMAIVKELSTWWFVEMAEYIANNPPFIMNVFRCAGIPNTLHGSERTEENSGKLDSYLVSEENCDSDSPHATLVNNWLALLTLWNLYIIRTFRLVKYPK